MNEGFRRISRHVLKPYTRLEMFALVMLGGSQDRSTLQTNYVIASKATRHQQHVVSKVPPSSFLINTLHSGNDMESLPLETLETICEYVGNSEPKRRSLLAFASTSKTCSAASARERFSRISIKVHSAKQLHFEFARISSALAVNDRKRHVRKLKAAGNICQHLCLRMFYVVT